MAEITEKRFPRIVFTDSQDNSDIGGGGSSDFSIAKVTITSDDDYDYPTIVTAIILDEDHIDIDGVWSGDTYETLVPLYQDGGCYWNFNPELVSCEVIEGDATLKSSSILQITGDCSLSFHAVGGDN